MRKKFRFLTIFLICVGMLLAAWAILFCRILIASFSDGTQKADAIVVLGAAQWGGQPSPMFQARLDHAYELYKQGYAVRIFLTGGIGKEETMSEADAGAQYLRNKGILPDALFIVPRGRTTFESLNSAADKIKQNNVNSSILVSHDFHNFRLEKMAKDIGINVVISPAESNNFFSKLHYMLRETVVYIAYILFGI